MKITKAMGIAALRIAMDKKHTPDELNSVWDTWKSWGWQDEAYFDLISDGLFMDQFYTALAMCAAIAGVKPEDVL